MHIFGLYFIACNTLLQTRGNEVILHGLSSSNTLHQNKGDIGDITWSELFDNVVLDKFHANLCTSDLQFGFKSRHSTSMCTMVLKETITYYATNNSS